MSARYRYKEVADFGYQVGLADRAFVNLGILVAKMAADGEIGGDDTDGVYKEFIDARRRGACQPKPDDLVKTDSDAAQWSKLRKCIEVGEKFRDRGVRMLECTANLLAKLEASTDQKELTYRGQYEGLLKVARTTMRDGHILNDDQIMELLLRN